MVKIGIIGGSGLDNPDILKMSASMKWKRRTGRLLAR